MRIVRFEDAEGVVGFGVERGDGEVLELEGDVFGECSAGERGVEVARLLAPVVPPAVFCIGLNYRKHAEETGAAVPEWPVVFMKQPGAVVGPGAAIELPRGLRSNCVDYEAELVIVIGRRCKNASVGEALDYVLGYSCGNDVSARDWQKDFGGGQFCRGKTFDTFAPLGPVIVTRDGVGDPGRLGIRTLLNGEVMQESTTADLIFSAAEIVSFLSGSTTLEPGTVIFTGTPAGVGMARVPPRWLRAGDEVCVEIEGVGRLVNPVVAEGH